jgi:VanZ family protein
MSALLWAAFIFYLSTATFGQDTSQSLLTGAVAFLHVTLSPAAFATVHEVCRKLAHLAEYGILSLLLYRSLPTPGGGERQRALWSVLAAAAYSLTDESHQLFVPGRHASIVDCAIDSTGAALAVLLALGYTVRTGKRRQEV